MVQRKLEETLLCSWMLTVKLTLIGYLHCWHQYTGTSKLYYLLFIYAKLLLEQTGRMAGVIVLCV